MKISKRERKRKKRIESKNFSLKQVELFIKNEINTGRYKGK